MECGSKRRLGECFIQVQRKHKRKKRHKKSDANTRNHKRARQQNECATRDEIKEERDSERDSERDPPYVGHLNDGFQLLAEHVSEDVAALVLVYFLPEYSTFISIMNHRERTEELKKTSISVDEWRALAEPIRLRATSLMSDVYGHLDRGSDVPKGCTKMAHSSFLFYWYHLHGCYLSVRCYSHPNALSLRLARPDLAPAHWLRYFQPEFWRASLPPRPRAEEELRTSAHRAVRSGACSEHFLHLQWELHKPWTDPAVLIELEAPASGCGLRRTLFSYCNRGNKPRRSTGQVQSFLVSPTSSSDIAHALSRAQELQAYVRPLIMQHYEECCSSHY